MDLFCCHSFTKEAPQKKLKKFGLPKKTTHFQPTPGTETYRVFLNAARDELQQDPHQVVTPLPQALTLQLQKEQRGSMAALALVQDGSGKEGVAWQH